MRNDGRSTWGVRGRSLTLDRPYIFGVLNATPDSFSDGGRFVRVDDAIAHVERMVAEGADAIDVGGESTRPQGATPVDAAEERRRVVPLVRELRRRFPDTLLSIDTVKSDVAEAALGEGADVVNDVSGFRLDPRMGEICASAGAGVILMHSRGGVSEMATYRLAEYGDDVVGEVTAELEARVRDALAAGVGSDSIVVDPGIGFTKRSEHSLRVLAELERIAGLGWPVMVGVSRKRFIGELTGVSEAAERVHGTTGANVVALTRGARLFRVHDVRPARHALDVAWAVLRAAGAAGGVPA
ncbi:MAG TPA: dihydropteroate synthase [Gemmatimonadaceae bacterium]|nr:dihydropteroate synthase [Gemmatimonadaceae bacterium]